MAKADLLAQLEAEHDEVAKLLEQLEQAEEPAKRDRLLTEIEQALAAHMEIEEREVYPLLAQLDGEMAEEANVEHEGARELIGKLRSLGVDQPGFGGVVAALKGAIEHHVEDEESEAFPKLREAFGGDLAGAADADADVDGKSRDELYERAQELDIPGRSSMTKDELAKAIAAAEKK
jgi:iron-sulfur cluster repair protein YtfE (RIC family)